MFGLQRSVHPLWDGVTPWASSRVSRNGTHQTQTSAFISLASVKLTHVCDSARRHSNALDRVILLGC